MYISFSGLQSTGKTTATFELARILKMKGHSTNVWTDIPRRCPLGINEDGRDNTQFWITGKMISETLELLDIYDYVISDRNTLDCVAYTMATHELRTGKGEITEIAATLYDLSIKFLEYQKADIYWVKSGYDYVDEFGRSSHSEFRELSQKWFNEVYEMAKKDLDIKTVDLKEIDLTKLAGAISSRN